MFLNLLGCVLPESSVSAECLSEPWWKDRKCSRSAVGILLTDHGGDIIWFFEIVPSWWEKPGRDFAEKHGDIVDEDEKDETGDDTVCDVVCSS